MRDCRRDRGHARSPARPQRACRAFTLVELLVVVAIIVILVAILMPSLRGAIDQAQIAQCLYNEHTISNACTSFALDNDTRLPPSEDTRITTGGNFDTWKLNWSGLGNTLNTWADFPVWGHYLSRDAFACPGDDRKVNPFLLTFVL